MFNIDDELLELRVSFARDYIMRTAMENDVDFLISPRSHVIYAGDGIPCSGYFLANPVTKQNMLAVGIGKPLEDWLPVLLHESCHMDQFIEQCKAWTDCTLPDADGKDSTDIVFHWIAGGDIGDYDIVDMLHRSMMVEKDCEERTLRKIIDFGFQDIINTEEYIQKSNSYILFYPFILERGKFYDKGREPYNVPEVWKHAPKTFDWTYDGIPSDLLKAFRKHL